MDETERRMDSTAVAAELAKAMFIELFPHDETLTKPPSQRFSDDVRPKPEDRFKHVESLADVEVGDMLYVIEADSEKRSYNVDPFSNHTAREALSRRAGSYMVVTGKRGKTQIEAELAIAPRGGWDTDLERLGETLNNSGSSEPIRMKVPSARSIARLGSAEELRVKIVADERFPQWKAAYEAAKVDTERKAAEKRAQAEVMEARERPLRKAAEAVNAIAGTTIVKDGIGRAYAPEIASKWLAEGKRLRVFVAGLAALGEISDEEHAEVLTHLVTLGLFKPEEGEEFNEDAVPPGDLYKVEDTGDGGVTWKLSGGSLIDGESVTVHIKHWRGEHPDLTVRGSADEITVRPRLFNGNRSRHGWRFTREITEGKA